MEEVNIFLLESQASSTKKAYKRSYETFESIRKTDPYCEESVLKWLLEQAKTKQPSTLWTETSHVTKYLELERNIVIPRDKINKFIKTLESTAIKKKAPAFSWDELFAYLKVTPNEPKFFTIKLYVLFAYFGAMRTSETLEITADDVTISKEGLYVKIIRKKTDKAHIGEIKLIPKMNDPLLCAVTIFALYRTVTTHIPQERLWIKYDIRRGKFVNSPIGKNTLAKNAMLVATALFKPDPSLFTGHSFRVSSATALADAGASVIALKNLGGWKSSTVAESYVRDSKKAKIDTAGLLSSTSKSSKSSSKSSLVFNNCNFQNCTFEVESSSQ